MHDGALLLKGLEAPSTRAGPKCRPTAQVLSGTLRELGPAFLTHNQRVFRGFTLRTRLSLLGLSLTLATGCFGDGDADTDQPTSGGAPSAATGGSESGDPEDDPYCPHAWNGFTQLDIFLAETGAISDDPDMPGATMNAHGEVALEAAELTGQHFRRAQEFVVDTEASDAFEAVLRYQERYMVPQAKLAATSSDFDAYGMASLEFLLQEGVAEAAASGALASGTISSYTLVRCESTRWP